MNRKIKFYVVACFGVAGSIFLGSCQKILHMDDPSPNEDQTFLVGTSLANVTPTVPAGWFLRDSLYAKTIVMDDGEERVAFVVVDNQGVPGWLIDRAKDSIYAQTGIPGSHVMVSSTHTHSSGEWAGDPIASTITPFQQLLVRQIAASVRGAVDDLQPAQIGWGSFNAPEHVHNRRWYLDTLSYSPYGILDSVRMNPGFNNPSVLVAPAGPVDPEVSIISIKSLAGEPLAIFANYSLHYVGIFANNISADYFGLFGNKVAELLNVNPDSSFVGIMSNGTSGDVSNQNFALPNPSLNLYQRSVLVANDLASKVATLYNQISYHDWVPLGAVSTNLTLQIREPSQEILDNVELIKANTSPYPLFYGHPYKTGENTYVNRLEGFLATYPSQVTVPLQAFSIGDLAVGAIPFEVFAETGLELKSSIPFDDSFVVGLANGRWGYLPTPAQHLKGGYESWITANLVEENSSELIVDELLDLFDTLND